MESILLPDHNTASDLQVQWAPWVSAHDPRIRLPLLVVSAVTC